MVVVLQQVDTNANFANWFIYVNGALQAYAPGATGYQLYPSNSQRPTAYLARSDWTGDNLWVGDRKSVV